MFNVLEATVRPLMLNGKVLDVAYELYLAAPPVKLPCHQPSRAFAQDRR
jgi:hypothetical protein